VSYPLADLRSGGGGGGGDNSGGGGGGNSDGGGGGAGGGTVAPASSAGASLAALPNTQAPAVSQRLPAFVALAALTLLGAVARRRSRRATAPQRITAAPRRRP
jgi:hypothetical protein